MASERPELELTIEELAPGGAGVALATIDGERRAVFVRETAVGDRVEAEVDLSRRPAHGKLLRLIHPGAARVAPPCPDVHRCGGCDWMHLSLEAQARAHAAFVRDALPEAWRAPVSVARAEKSLGYRTRARLHVRASGGRAIVGMHEAGTHEPAEVERCVVLDERLDAARVDLRTLLEGARGRGDAQIALGALPERGEPRRVVLELRWIGDLVPESFEALERATRGPLWQGARVWIGDVKEPAVVGDPTPWMMGADGAPLRLAPGGFAQASPEANVLLATKVADLAARVATGKPTLELFAGAGNFTVMLARRVGALTAVESSRAACDAARANLAARGLTAKIVEADAETRELPPSVRLVVLDPPRAGARGVAAKLAERPVRSVLYVSCDPQTLRRDLAILEPKYSLAHVSTVEMFPQTSHVECVVLLEKKTKARS
jgi:23S rRNA (uracil1939-C5)-methyltransferase